ncbi:hypothetical protein [Micromonospora okii]|uniref:hypothetical protein n=1 Tax=Micromonospora okii TaxID=1182970 RepID=UPI001E4A3A01|nr:hypothetical protein [Micromonospora okii]
MPWRGPSEPGEFPTLGYDVGEWIEEHCVVPDGYRMGAPYRLTDEMWTFLVHFYRLYPHAGPWPAPDALRYVGGQLRRSQKWGKDPFGAAIILAEALGPTRFDGWNAAGDPVGSPYPSPLIVCLGTAEDQTDNTWRPLLSMLRGGPLVDLPGMDAGQTRVELPSGGRIEPVTTSARARLGAPMTFVTLTESHLFTLQGGFRKVAGAVKRNVAGMDGRWLELTNAWDPTEGSEAQVTAEAGDERVYVDTVEPQRVESLTDDEALYAELLRQYGDSARERGGWVNIRGRIFHEVRSARHMESDRRRFFLNEIVVGQAALVDPTHWDLQAREDQLRPGDRITLGFDGSRNRDATALIACRLGDGRLFTLGVWESPQNADRDWRVDRVAVDRRVRDAFGAYQVVLMYADPYRWQDYLDLWSAAFPDRVLEFPTNVEQRMDKAIERFQTAAADITHDGSETLAQHMKNAVIVKGSRKKLRPGEETELAQHYLKLAKRGDGLWIDAAVAAVLAYHARGRAIEDGGLAPDAPPPAEPVSIPVTAGWSETSDLAVAGF